MSLSIIHGDFGSGKTLLATYFATKFDGSVYANYKIEIENYNHLKPIHLNQLNERSLIIIDEAYTWLESRVSMRELNRYLSYILFQSRKRELDFLLTLQMISTVDIRFREMADYFILAEAVQNGYRYMMVKNTWRNVKPIIFYLPENKAKKIYDIYDTFEKINPIDKEMEYNINDDTEELSRYIDDLVNELLTEYPNPTRPIVNDFCLKRSISKRYSEYIYNRLKAVQARGSGQ
ncbi:MAG: hypothetical protein R6V50_02280 [Thermoplasmatota archaeon]